MRQGTPAGSPAAPSVPANSILLATVDVLAGATSITNARITDGRTPVAIKANVLPGIALGSEAQALRDDVPNFVVSTGSSNAYVGTYTPAHASLIVGHATPSRRTSATPRPRPSTPTASASHAIKKGGGGVDLVSGDIPSGAMVELKWDADFQLMSVAATIPGSIALVKRVFLTSVSKSTSSTSFADFDATCSVDCACTANTVLVINLTGPFYQASNYGSLDFSVGGSRVGDATFGLFYFTNTVQVPVNVSHTIMPGAGTITVKPQWKAGAGATVSCGNGSMGPACFEVLQFG